MFEADWESIGKTSVKVCHTYISMEIWEMEGTFQKKSEVELVSSWHPRPKEGPPAKTIAVFMQETLGNYQPITTQCEFWPIEKFGALNAIPMSKIVNFWNKA